MDAGGDMAAFYTKAGTGALSAGHTAFAVRLLEKALAIDPLDGQTHLDLGRAYLAQQAYALALDALSTAVGFLPENAEAHRLYGWTAYLLDRPTLALAQLQEAVALAPDNPQPHFNLGVLQVAAGQWTQAAATLSAGIERANDSPDRGMLDGLYAELVVALRAVRNDENSEMITDLLDQVGAGYTFAQVYDRDNYSTYLDRGWYLYTRNLYELSAAMSARGVALNPTEPRVRFNQGLAELAAGQSDRATASYLAGIEAATTFGDGVARLNEALGDLRANRDDPAGLAPALITLLEEALAGD